MSAETTTGSGGTRRRRWLRLPPYRTEIGIWCCALIAAFVIDPASGSLVSFCPLHALGWDYCPGCGLGRSIAYLTEGNVTASLAMHPLGIPATIVILYRIIRLYRLHKQFTAVARPHHTP